MGGDEFLVIQENAETVPEPDDIYRFADPHGKDAEQILLSISTAEGKTEVRSDLFRLISQADKALYGIKKRTHTPEYGGHDRRKHSE